MADDERESDEISLNYFWSQEAHADKRAFISAVRANTSPSVLD